MTIFARSRRPSCRTPFTTMRWASTGIASRLTSSGIAYVRPSTIARALDCAIKRDGSAGADAELKLLVRSRRVNQIEHVIVD